MTLFDFIAILILAVSAVIGFVRGAAREVMTVLAFNSSYYRKLSKTYLEAPDAGEEVHARSA